MAMGSRVGWKIGVGNTRCAGGTISELEGDAESMSVADVCGWGL